MEETNKKTQMSHPWANISPVNLEKIVESCLDIICITNLEGHFIWLNSACEKTWGYQRHELIGRNYIDFVVAAERDFTKQVTEQIVLGKNLKRFDNRCIRKDGSTVPMAWSATWDEGNQIMYCVGRDALDQIYLRGHLQESERYLKEALRIAKLGIWTFDTSTNKATWSDELFDLYGVDPQQSHDLVSVFNSLVHEEDTSIIKQAFLIANSITTPFTHRIVRPDGRIITVMQRISKTSKPYGTGALITGTTQDVTDEVEQATKLLHREQKFKALLENNLDMVGIIDSIGTYTYVSENTEKILGYKPDFLIGRNAFEFIHSDEAQDIFQKFATLNKHAGALELPIFKFRSQAGDWRWIECKVTYKVDDPIIKGFIVNSRDVTQKKEATEKILRLSKIAEDTPNAVVKTDVAGNITWVNKAFSKITEYSFEESIGRKPGDFLQGKDSNAATIALMRQRLIESKSFEVEIINYTKSGRAYWMNIQCQPQFDLQGKLTGFFAIQTDITEKKNLQERLRAELEKKQMEITAHIVKAQEKERDEIGKELHDNVNQILSTVKLYLGMLKEPQLDKEELISKSMSFVQNCIDEIRHLSKRLSSPHHNDLKLEEAVEQLIYSVSSSGKLNIVYQPHNIENCNASMDTELAIYRIMQEHLTNILKHARASNVEISLACISNVLNLKVVDDGLGFEMKAKRKGVGLSNIMNRAFAVNGKVDIQSAPGRGCTLYGVFPI